MARHLRKAAELGLDAITIEGGLIAPEQVAAIAGATRDAKLAASYEVPKGLTLADEISRYFRIGQGIWRGYARIEAPTTTQTAAFVHELLAKVFGFDDLAGPVEHREGTRRYRIALEARGGRVPIVVAPPAQDERGRPIGFTRALPEFGDGSEGRARRAPIVLLQDWLNANPSFYWGLVFAGDRVRLMRDNASLTRAAWIEADLGAMFRDEMFADFTAWWLLTHTSRFGPAGAPPSNAPLEQAREAGLKQGTAARERLREGVEAALTELGQGLIEENPAIREQLAADPATTMRLFEELLRTVYRLIFLAVAEERDLLHPRTTGREARALYEGSYSFAFWRDRSARRAAYDAHHDAWEGMKVTLGALEQGQPLLGLPALGGLFARGGTPTMNAARIPNRRFLRAVWSLGFIEVDSTRTRINWRDMRTEELGSVYESLLELRPTLTPAGEFSLAAAKGNARKTSGSYYTPDSLVETLLDSALDPVLEQAEANGGFGAILDLKIIDPACGSGHFLLGAARRMAGKVAQLRDPDAPDEQAALRDVVSRCIHGVDRNPMAVELAKVALWIESVSPGQPLGFLDANIRCGDALLGVFSLDALEEGVPDAAYKPLTGDDKATANGLKKLNQAERESGLLRLAIEPDKLSRSFRRFHSMPETTPREVAARAEEYARIRHSPDWVAMRQACDAYVAAFLLPKPPLPSPQAKPLVPTTRHLRDILSGGMTLGTGAMQGQLAATVDSAVFGARAFHWPIEFPDVLLRPERGFDVVLGNPPWEVVQLGEEEYFESRAPEIAEMKGASRKRAIAALETERPELFAEFARDKRQFEAMNDFARASGRFELTARGKVNTYGLFAEHFLNLTRERGRAGVIVPTGIATDATTAPFFGHLVSAARLARLCDFENREKLFPAVDSRMKFCLLTVGSEVRETEFAFFLADPAHLEDDRRRFTLSPHDIARINPNTKTAPVFRAREDARLTAAIYDRVPVLIDEAKGAAGNPWGVEFRQGLFNMTSDSGLFRTAAQLAGEGWVRDGTDWVRPDAAQPRAPGLAMTGGRDTHHLDLSTGSNAPAEARYAPLYEAKMIHQFDHRFGDYGSRGDDRGYRVMPETPIERYQDPTFEPEPFYWAPDRDTDERLGRFTNLRWLLTFKDVTAPTNERTVIMSAIPRVAVGHTSPLMSSDQPAPRQAALLANLNSLALDNMARSKVAGLHLTYGYLKQFPVLPPAAYTEADLAFIAPRVLELSYTSHAMAPFARDLGYDGAPFAWDEDRRAQLRAELDAWYALAYGLTRDELRYVLDPKDVMGADYPSETFRVLQKNEIAKYGEYRTRRLVLAAYDAQVAAAPDTVSLADSQWQGVINDELDVRLLLAAILKRMRQPRPLREVTFAFLYAAQPHLLTPHLTAAAAAEWQRLVGDAATLPVSSSVPSFSASRLVHFATAQAQLAARRAWRFDVETSTVERGAAIYDNLLPSWAEGRADFVWHALRSINLDASTAALSQEERAFVAQAAAA
ncbi:MULTISPECIES: N-6 DNA methylase [unclassified Sphingopyxis]|uniref:N-6 DNA methylase n=1 Tax=unclassified Sphingopyxis TaxID=2614943 RepID=UPI000736CDB9|nr:MULTISPECIES: N-6 DNA methylase [unclassified Sphingopyxis]KTE46421.1 type II DNA modification enzyme [Sphingopyxis sp. HIX]KTE85024.1 type II DNA modification enzyme [Sphingopyxis sp. HXXIV]